jgi:hypothetical protein
MYSRFAVNCLLLVGVISVVDVAAVGSRFASAQERPNPPFTGGPLEPGSPARVDPDIDLEQQKELEALRARYERFLEDHAQEKVDRAFQTRWTERLRGNLDAMGRDLGFEIREISCRESTCVASLRWPDFIRAMEGYVHIVHESAPRCHTSILLDPPRDPTSPYEHKVLYSDCQPVDATGHRLRQTGRQEID